MANQQGALKFSGLNLTSNGGELPPGASPVFHNCDIAPDGDVVRRPGSNVVANVDASAVGQMWSQVVKTRSGTEYLVVVSQLRITIQAFEDVNGVATLRTSMVKTAVFSRPLVDVNFVLLTAPYDRLLILTDNHPPIQLSFLERTADFTCTQALFGTITAPYTATDSRLWLDDSEASTLLYNPANKTYYSVDEKTPGFTLNVVALGMVLNEVRQLTLIQITWQWWAEALNWTGNDFSQNTVRYSTTAIDQNVKIPTQLLSDLEPRYLTSAYRGIIMSLGNDGATTGFLSPTASPAAVGDWSHGSGQRYIYTATNAPLHTPFFATFQGIEAVGTQTPISFHRTRELRFNAGSGCTGTNLDLYVNGVKKTQRFSISTTFSDGDYLTYKDTFTTQRNIVGTASAADNITFVLPLATGRPLNSQADVVIVNTQAKWLGLNARKVMATDLPPAGGPLDGCYVPAFGLGSYADYLRGRFPPFGYMFRDRLVLKTSDESTDQLLFSATSDELSPGNFYSFFQITDGLEGTADDPFTVNITTKSREKLTALLAWQQSLFVFTAVSTYSLTGGEVFGPDSYTTGLVASYGAFNTRCVVATNLTVLFLNRYGVFDLLNKNNTSDYGSFERSEKVRAIFSDYTVVQSQETLPWLCLNDANNKVYLGLPTKTDTTACQNILSLNLSWDSWSTLSSALPFNLCMALQLLNYTIFIDKPALATVAQIVHMDALHHLDFCRDVNGVTPAGNVFGLSSIPALAPTNIQGIVRLQHPTPPLLREYASPLTKDEVFYYGVPDSSVTLTPRNWMRDVPELAPFILGSSDTEVALVSNTEPFVMYPAVSARTSSTVTVSSVTSVTGTINPLVHVLGVIYPSVFASTPFNTDGLGRLKRLKKLHLLFDNTSVLTKRYFNYKAMVQNSAIAIVRYNYGDGEFIADAQLIGDYARFDAMSLDVTASSKEREQLSIPLQGYGADYQLYVCSTGGDAFKLTSYEMDVQPQLRKTYVP